MHNQSESTLVKVSHGRWTLGTVYMVMAAILVMGPRAENLKKKLSFPISTEASEKVLD